MCKVLDRINWIAVIGSGTIGSSWAALFAANGIQTIVYDPDEAAEKLLWTNIKATKRVLKSLDRFKTAPSLEAIESLVSFTTSLVVALENADLIQENGPENLLVKLTLLRNIDESMKPGALVLSSTSGIAPSSMQVAFQKHPDRFLVGHPFNPPHLIPLVEVVGGVLTSMEAIDEAMCFYEAIGKKPIKLRREIPGHIANRLQSALFREIMYLLEERVADVADIETAMEYGPGLRWGVLGPSLLLHLGGGPGGAKTYADKFMHHLMSWYAPQDPLFGAELEGRWVKETLEVVAGQTYEALCERRDLALIGAINAKGELAKR
jgi:carnitine 3-dehydrogenase